MQTIRRFEIIQALAAHRRFGRAARTLSPPVSAFMEIVRTIERDLDASQDGGAILETGGHAGPPHGKHMSR